MLWQKSGTRFASDSLVQGLPFNFQLPTGLPPSYSCQGSGYYARVKYELRVRGERPGILRPDRTVHTPLLVVPAHEEGAKLHSMLSKQGWLGAWKTLKGDVKLRKYPWGAYSEVHATVRIFNVCCAKYMS